MKKSKKKSRTLVLSNKPLPMIPDRIVEFPIALRLPVGGNGLYTRFQGFVTTNRVKVTVTTYPDAIYGKAKLYLTDWDTRNGLIYTEKTFLRAVREELWQRGLPEDVEYSEQGQQGEDFVDFDIGEKLLKHILTLI